MGIPNFFIPTNYGIELAVLGKLDQITPIKLQGVLFTIVVCGFWIHVSIYILPRNELGRRAGAGSFRIHALPEMFGEFIQ